MKPKLEVGRVVRSKAGHDAGDCFVVVGLLEDGRAQLCDGRTRKVDSPKKKQHKHFIVLTAMCDDVQEKIAAGEKLYDHEIRAAMSRALNALV